MGLESALPPQEISSLSDSICQPYLKVYEDSTNTGTVMFNHDEGQSTEGTLF